METDELLEQVMAEEQRDEEEELAIEPLPDTEAEEVPEEEADPDVAERLAEPPEAPAEVPPTAAPEAAPRLQLITIKEILGVPLWYERDGNPRPHRFPVAKSFFPIVEETLRQTLRRTPAAFGKPKRISSAGFYVGKELFHGKGRACDWDRLVFEKLEIAPLGHHHAAGSRAVRQRYWAFAAICRSNSSYVLHGEYDNNHKNHIHQDNGDSVAFARKPSTVKLVQAVLNDIHGQSPRLPVDGQFRSKTEAALKDAIARLDIGDDYNDVLVWKRFLRRSGRLGFARSVRR